MVSPALFAAAPFLVDEGVIRQRACHTILMALALQVRERARREYVSKKVKMRKTYRRE